MSRKKARSTGHTRTKPSPPDHNGVRHLLDENGEIIDSHEADEVDDLLKKLIKESKYKEP